MYTNCTSTTRYIRNVNGDLTHETSRRNTATKHRNKAEPERSEAERSEKQSVPKQSVPKQSVPKQSVPKPVSYTHLTLPTTPYV